jgi:hypothetical protein
MMSSVAAHKLVALAKARAASALSVACATLTEKRASDKETDTVKENWGMLVGKRTHRCTSFAVLAVGKNHHNMSNLHFEVGIIKRKPDYALPSQNAM